ncbi:40S ribosomal protein S25 [Tanacetum coccineum]
MILESVENGPLIWPSIEENGVTRPKKYSELSATEAIQADCDIKATIIILQKLPPEVYALERRRKLYDEFDKFAYKKWETLLLNTLPPEWSKFVTDVKLVQDLHTTNVDQLHAYLGQHEFHANEVRLMHEPQTHPLDFWRQTSLAAGTTRTYTPGSSGSNSGKQRTVICYNYKGEGHMSKQCTKPKRKRDDSWFKDKVLLVQA